MNRDSHRSDKNLLITFLVKVCLIILAVWLLLTFVVSITVHYGNNMYPAIRDGDCVISFRMQNPYINAAVIYHHDGKKCVGRVIALGGSEVTISDSGEITVNGVAPSEEIFYLTYPSENSLNYGYLKK